MAAYGGQESGMGGTVQLVSTAERKGENRRLTALMARVERARENRVASDGNSVRFGT
jgi:hypothetical protein